MSEDTEDKELEKISLMLSEQEQEAKKKNLLVTDALINGERDFYGLKVRPVTLSTLAMLEKLKSPLVTGDVEGADNVIEALLFLWIQTAPKSEVIANCLTSKIDSRITIEGKALELGDQLSLTAMEDLVNEVTDMMAEATKTKVDVIPSETKAESRKKSKNK